MTENDLFTEPLSKLKKKSNLLMLTVARLALMPLLSERKLSMCSLMSV